MPITPITGAKLHAGHAVTGGDEPTEIRSSRVNSGPWHSSPRSRVLDETAQTDTSLQDARANNSEFSKPRMNSCALSKLGRMRKKEWERALLASKSLRRSLGLRALSSRGSCSREIRQLDKAREAATSLRKRALATASDVQASDHRRPGYCGEGAGVVVALHPALGLRVADDRVPALGFRGCRGCAGSSSGPG